MEACPGLECLAAELMHLLNPSRMFMWPVVVGVTEGGGGLHAEHYLKPVPPPPSPFFECGVDPTPDELPCKSDAVCG
jgi:hypothetical protein